VKKIIIPLVLAASMLAAPAMSDTVRIGTEGAYAPWNFLDDNGKLAGYEIDLGAALCAEAGLTCEFVANEWDSMIPNLIAGNYDAIMAGMSITDERLETINFSAPYYPPDPSKYAAAKGEMFDFAALSGKKIGVQGATIQAAYAEEMFAANNTILSFETPDQSVADLAAGNIDLLLADGSFLEPVVEGSSGAMVLVGPDVLIGGGVGVGLRKKDGQLADQLNAALIALKANGTVDKLIMEYFEKGPFFTE
jgi:polar amino acid transport system substrate-binding protein